MEPNIKSGDITIFIKNKAIRRFNIVSILPPNANYSTNPYIKRIIALEGETITIIDGTIFIDGKNVSQNFKVLKKDLLNVNPFTVPNGQVFVLGDNRLNSLDSSELGPFNISDIVGRLILVIPQKYINIYFQLYSVLILIIIKIFI